MTYNEISAAQQMMKLAINNQNHVDSLTGYYRDLIDDFNNERSDWVIHYDNLKVTAEDQYLLDQQILLTKQQSTELQKQLATKKAALIYQRQKFFKFIENNGALKKKLEETKNNYREMMSACKPIGLNNSKFNNSVIGNRQQSKLSSFNHENGNSHTTPYQLQLINITKSHNQHKNKLKQEIDHLKEELNEHLRQYSDRQQESKSEYCQELQKLCELERKNMILTSEFFRYRTTNSHEEKKIQQQSEIYRLKNLASLQKLKNLQKFHDIEFKNVDAEVKKQNKHFKMQYDEQLKKKSEHLSILKQQHERIQDIYLNKIKKMQEELKTTNHKLKNTEDKSKVQINSLKSQIRILRSRLQDESGVHKMRKQMARGGSHSSEQQYEESSASLQYSELQRINHEVNSLAKQIDKKK